MQFKQVLDKDFNMKPEFSWQTLGNFNVTKDQIEKKLHIKFEIIIGNLGLGNAILAWILIEDKYLFCIGTREEHLDSYVELLLVSNNLSNKEAF